MNKKWKSILQVGFTYIGTMVGAGFATGQEILQFFTRYGWLAMLTILISCFIFIWIGTKMMLIAQSTKAHSYEDLNKLLFGDHWGRIFSYFMAIVLFGTTAVMLAGAGSVFAEHFRIPYQLGLLLTLVCAYLVLTRGIHGILVINSIIVPLMLTFTLITVYAASHSAGAGNWITLDSQAANWRLWLSPLLYTSLNLSLAQAVLVPIGATIDDTSVIKWAGLIGGAGMGGLLLAGHFALSTEMPGITQFQIPMAFLIQPLGKLIQFMFLLIIYAEIFTTLIADAYGLTLQVKKYIAVHEQLIIIAILIGSYLISQLGFSTLVSTLYPLFGALSFGWLLMMFRRRIA